MRRTVALLALTLTLSSLAGCSSSSYTTASRGNDSQLPGVAATAFQSGLQPISAQKAHDHVLYLTSEKLAGRGTGTEGDRLSAQYVEDYFRQLGLTTARQTYPFGYSNKTSDNVMAMLPGSVPGDTYIAVGAHRDHLGKNGKTWYPGADDNASGTAAVMEMAANMAAAVAQGKGPKVNILFLSFSGEELGLLGSSYYAKHAVIPDGKGGVKSIAIKKIRGYVNLDVIAIGQLHQVGVDAEGPQYPFPPGVSPFHKMVAGLAARRGANVYFERLVHEDTAPVPPHIIREPIPMGASSDHAPFREAGIPAPCFFSYPVMRKYLHTPDDTLPEFDRITKKPEDRFNIDILVEVAGVAQDTVIAMANN